MILHFPAGRIELVLGDITLQEVDAIVNAANSRLAGGGGVDGAIHRRGGPAIMEETSRRYPDGCPSGSAVITGAGNLAAKFVIHAVGPVWSGGHRGEDDLLRSAYRSCLDLAREYDCASIAFPSLSTGAYRFPLDRASRLALAVAAECLQDSATPSPAPNLIRFVLFTHSAMSSFLVSAEPYQSGDVE